MIHLRLDAIYRNSRSRMITVVGLPHHDQLMLPLEERVPRDLSINEVFLDEHQRSSFEEDAILPLLHGAYDLVIGLPPDEENSEYDKLRSVVLYEPQLQAMLPRYPTRDSISIEELAKEHRLLVPSPDFRSRKLLDDSMVLSGIEVASNGDRLRLESHVTKNLVRYGWRSKGTVVLPSDIAMAWKDDGDCAGVIAKNFCWVPVLHKDEPLTHKVNATMRLDDHRVEPVFELLLEVVAELRPKLEGTLAWGAEHLLQIVQGAVDRLLVAAWKPADAQQPRVFCG